MVPTDKRIQNKYMWERESSSTVRRDEFQSRIIRDIKPWGSRPIADSPARRYSLDLPIPEKLSLLFALIDLSLYRRKINTDALSSWGISFGLGELPKCSLRTNKPMKFKSMESCMKHLDRIVPDMPKARRSEIIFQG